MYPYKSKTLEGTLGRNINYILQNRIENPYFSIHFWLNKFVLSNVSVQVKNTRRDVRKKHQLYFYKTVSRIHTSRYIFDLTKFHFQTDSCKSKTLEGTLGRNINYIFTKPYREPILLDTFWLNKFVLSNVSVQVKNTRRDVAETYQ
jgi:macrodomain Ter protein organizer (MatP/YcbG family)